MSGQGSLVCALLLALASSGAARAQQPDTAGSPAPVTSPANSTAATPAAPLPPPPAATSAAPAFQPDNRVILSGDGDWLTGVKGSGGGGSISYLGQVNADALVGVAGEYQTLAGSHWEFGSLNLAYSHALTQTTRWSISGEAHEGSGQSGRTHFGYAIEALGGGLAVPGGMTLTAEERQIDVDTSHGSLPKAGLSKAWGTHVLTSFGYAQSTGGNLATQYGLARIDILSAPIQFVVGGDFGHVAPAVLDIQGILLPQARRLSEEFVGITKPTRHVDLSLLADRIDLQGIVRLTLTLTATVHLR
ncbi:MAG TPA: hypothetical protein VMF64_12590 [Steroidobacteraceae bacterium]|nr:hypothetical protein [Steroidobacteraceae bacterium]